MLELFPDQPAYEYSQLINILYSFVWAFILASLIAITHKVTFTGDTYPRNFFQSLILGAIVTTMVMMAIGDSLARGLGVFGAMAIIRFRTRIDDPRDVLFLFAALSTGLAIGVYGYTISFAGSLLFCLVAVVLHVSPFKIYTHHNTLFVTVSEHSLLSTVTGILQQHCNDFKMVNISVSKEKETRYQFRLSLKPGRSKDDLIETLRKVEGLTSLKITTNEILAP
jgi:uncharacterized membrane protein YhiD involved in acid resistance